MIPLTVYGAYQVSQTLYEKVRNVDYSQEQIEELDAQGSVKKFVSMVKNNSFLVRIRI